MLYVFIFLLPLYQWSMVALLKLTGSTMLVSAIQPWKEVLIFATLGLVGGYHLLFVQRVRLKLLDLLMLGYLALNLLYIVIPFATSPVTRLYGFRSLVLLVFLYFLGRVVPLAPIRQKQLINAFLLLGIGTGIFALVDRFLLPIDWPTRLGFYDYLASESASGSIGFIGPMNMPWTFWTSTGMRRTSSFFANPLDMAASVHLMGVAALVVMLMTRRRTRWHLLAKVAFGLTLIALLFSISRTSIVTFALETMLVAFLLRRHQLLLLIILMAMVGFVAALFSPLGAFILETITLRNSSMLGHFEGWEDGFLSILQTPWGLGPGTSGHAGARSGLQVGGESQYVITGVQLGVMGLFFYVMLQVVAIRDSIRLFRRSAGPTQMLALITGVSRVGLAIVGLTANNEIYLFSAYVSWWLVGWVHQRHDTDLTNAPPNVPPDVPATVPSNAAA
ncbi:MAG: hypothetical protein IT328_08230 [Caldilineaceae bacterium]|nr:hypothetical protein [Caldilineaceae bacterium]